MRACIYGAGSLGTVLGAYITKNGGQVDLINRNKAHVEMLRKNGARIVGTVDMTVPVSAMTPDEMTGQYDLIILLTKQLANAEVVKGLLPFLSGDGTIVTMQNGIPELGIADVAGAERTVGCTVQWGATLLEPGVAELTSEPDSMNFGLGIIEGGNITKLGEIKRFLELMCPVEIEENFIGVRWSKLLINAAFSGMSAVTGTTFGEAAGNPASRKYVQLLIKECIDVAAAAKITIAPVQGVNIVALLDYRNPLKKKIANMLIPVVIKKHARLKASMLQDLENGKKTEVDCINGIVCEYGKKYGVPTPVNEMVVKIVHGIEEGKFQPSPENVKLFEKEI